MTVDSAHFVTVITIKNWEEFESLGRGCGPVVFRGQGDSEWDLKTNYEREFIMADCLRVNATHESEMLHECISQGHLFVQDPPSRDDWVSWLAEMQHYGAPTRLLDVTRSKYIALFFALTGMKNGEKTRDGAVWEFDVALADKVFYDRLCEKMPHCVTAEAPPWLRGGILPYKEDGWKIANAAIGCEPIGRITQVCSELARCKRFLNGCYKKGMVLHVAPRRANKRLIAQQGEFLFPFNLSHTFVQNLLGPIGGSNYEKKLVDFGTAGARCKAKDSITPRVIKIIIPGSLREEFLDRLLEMNITYQTLFPDDFGFMKALQFQRDRRRTGLKLLNSRERGLIASLNEFEQ